MDSTRISEKFSVAPQSPTTLLAYVAGQALTVSWILDTRPHADHLSAAHHLRHTTGAPTALEARVLFWPGHTLAFITNVVSDAAFAHDTSFLPDAGTARVDVPVGCAKRLWASIQAILSLPEDTRLFTGHDYQPGARELRWKSSASEQVRSNIPVVGKSEANIVQAREARDATAPMPTLFLQAPQVNLRGGRLRQPESNGLPYFKLPLDAFPGAVW